MKLVQTMIKEANEPDYIGIDDSIRQRLSNYKSHEQQWILTELRKGENIKSIIDGLEYYREKIKDNRYQQILKSITNTINPKSLTQITLQQIKAAQQQYDAKYGGISKRGTKKKAKETKHEYISILTNEPDLKVVKIEKTDDTTGAAEAAREIAKETDWCVSHIETGERYLKRGPLYYIEHEGNRYLCHIESEQLMDVYDEEYEIDIELYYRLVEYIEGVGIFLKDKTLPEYRDIIKHYPRLAYLYARDIIKGRWPEAEPYIIKNPEWAHHYAADVIKGRWPEAEPIIIQDIGHAYWYAINVVKGRWPEIEPNIIQDIGYAYQYGYARYVIKGRWPEIEPNIMKIPSTAYIYARDVIKGRWPEAENIMIGNPINVCLDYYKWFKDGERWPSLENRLLNDKRIKPLTILKYFIKAMIRIPTTHREIEQAALARVKPLYLFKYAARSINKRWPEAEPIIRNTGIWPRYKKHFGIKD